MTSMFLKSYILKQQLSIPFATRLGLGVVSKRTFSEVFFLGGGGRLLNNSSIRGIQGAELLDGVKFKFCLG